MTRRSYPGCWPTLTVATVDVATAPPLELVQAKPCGAVGEGAADGEGEGVGDEMGEALGDAIVGEGLGDGLAPVVAAHALSSVASSTALSCFFMRPSFVHAAARNRV